MPCNSCQTDVAHSTTPHCFFFGGCALDAALLGGCLGAAAGALLTTGNVGALLCGDCRSLRCGSGLLPLLLLAVASALCCIAVRSSRPARTAVVASWVAATPKRSRRTAPVTWPMTALEYSSCARALSCCSSCSAGQQVDCQVLRRVADVQMELSSAGGGATGCVAQEGAG